MLCEATVGVRLPTDLTHRAIWISSPLYILCLYPLQCIVISVISFDTEQQYDYVTFQDRFSQSGDSWFFSKCFHWIQLIFLIIVKLPQHKKDTCERQDQAQIMFTISILCDSWIPVPFRESFITFDTLIYVNRVFSKCTRMAIMPILASEALIPENKKIPVTKCYPSEYWTTGLLIPSPTCSSLH